MVKTEARLTRHGYSHRFIYLTFINTGFVSFEATNFPGGLSDGNNQGDS